MLTHPEQFEVEMPTLATCQRPQQRRFCIADVRSVTKGRTQPRREHTTGSERGSSPTLDAVRWCSDIIPSQFDSTCSVFLCRIHSLAQGGAGTISGPQGLLRAHSALKIPEDQHLFLQLQPWQTLHAATALDRVGACDRSAAGSKGTAPPALPLGVLSRLSIDLASGGLPPATRSTARLCDCSRAVSVASSEVCERVGDCYRPAGSCPGAVH